MNILVCVLLNCAGTGVTVYAVNPGVVHSDLSRYVDQTIFPGASWLYNSFTKLVVKTPQQGAQTTLHCALDRNCAQENGLYYRWDDRLNNIPNARALYMFIHRHGWISEVFGIKLTSEFVNLPSDIQEWRLFLILYVILPSLQFT